MAQISVKTFAETDLTDFLKMSQLEYGPSASTDSEHIRWKHLASPFGVSSSVNLIEAEQIVGRALIQPRILCTASKMLNVASVMDLLIDREHRTTPSNFMQITKASGAVANFDLVYHTSNDRTFQLYSKLFRFPNPFTLRAYGFPVRFAGVLTSIIGRRLDAIDWITAPLRWLLGVTACAAMAVTRLDISERAISDDELDALSAKCLRQSGPHLARTNAFLKWRFADAPLWHATVHRIDRQGRFMGYVVTRKVELDGLTHLVLMDFLIDVDTPLLVRIALRLYLIRKTITSKADALFTLVNSCSAVARACVGFPLVSVPDKLLPHATPIFVRARGDDYKELETDSAIHLTLADLDYF